MFGISRDSLWSHRAWAEALGIEIPLLSDWDGEVIRAFGVARVAGGMRDVATRSVFLISEDRVVAAWLLETPHPDIDAIIAALG